MLLVLGTELLTLQNYSPKVPGNDNVEVQKLLLQETMSARTDVIRRSHYTDRPVTATEIWAMLCSSEFITRGDANLRMKYQSVLM
jgi:hypothetical protein